MRIEIAGIVCELRGVESLFGGSAARRYRPFLSERAPDLSLDVRRLRERPRVRQLPEQPVVVIRAETPDLLFIERLDNPFTAYLDLAGGQGGITLDPNIYCLDSVLRVVYSVLLTRRGGILLHSAAIHRQDRAMLFAGKSESGKTTLCAQGFESILSDELVALSPDGDGWVAHGTPFWGEARPGDNPASARVGGLYLLRKGAQHEVRPADRSAALLEVLGCCFFLGPREMTGSVFDACARLVDETLVGEFAFHPDPSVVSYLDREAMSCAV
jgi:hypothetical protein